MSEFTSFVAMTQFEAQSYLSRFMEEMASSLERLASLVSRDLTFTPSSLQEVWSQAMPLLAWRAGYQTPVPGQPGRQFQATELESPDDLPSWFHHPSSAGYARFSAETLWLIDGTARYLGETVIRNLGGNWESGRERAKGYIFQNQPVVVGITPAAVSPMQTCAVLAAKALGASPAKGPQSLNAVYDLWSGELQE